MNQPVLIGFGDSWAAGHDLLPGERCYLELTSDILGIPCQNYAVGSSSLPHMILQFKHFVSSTYFPKNQYHAVFFLTAVERNFFYDQDTKELKHLGPSSHPQHEYYRIYNKEYGEFVLNNTVLTLQRLCDVYNIKDYYLPGWQQVKLWPEVDHTKFYKQGQGTATDLFGSTQDFVPLDQLLASKNLHFGPGHGHPNQLGHEKIARALVEWMKPCI